MLINQSHYKQKGLRYIIRSAVREDARYLPELRVQIDGETENLDREMGESYINEVGFEKLIEEDSKGNRNLFLICEIDGRIVGFSRCEGNHLRRMAHKVEFGVCVLKEYWGYGIGTSFLKESIQWADSHGIKKITLSVLETNEKAIMLYKRYGFEVEGLLKKDKLLSDGNYYNTIIMGRVNE